MKLVGLGPAEAVAAQGELIYLTSGHPEDENSFANPRKVRRCTMGWLHALWVPSCKTTRIGKVGGWGGVTGGGGAVSSQSGWLWGVGGVVGAGVARWSA